MNFKGKTFFITGASRGIGLAIAKKLGSEGARIVIAAKTAEAHPKLEGTIFTAAEEIKKAGGEALALQVDIRDEAAIQKAIDETVAKFGGIDGVILNASAIFPFTTDKIETKRFDLMHSVIVRGHFLTVQKALPHLKKSSSPMILALCPPLQNLHEKWLSPMVAYSIMKFSLSMMVKGWAGEFKKDKIQVNGLWPRTYIATAAVKNLLGGDDAIKRSRKPEIVSDAAHWLLSHPEITGEFFLDEDIMKKMGKDPQSYALDPSQKPMLDAYID
jgi:citronellol/citronellal dehydrogenase